VLIERRSWLLRADFVDKIVEVVDGPPGGQPMAFVDWAAALDALEGGRFACSSSEDRVLRIAASIAEGIPVDLRDAACGLDWLNPRRAPGALVRAAGHGRTGAPRGDVR